ncbi:SPOC domain-like protein [Macrolepiota fuliginosa MF-IS2]|uniref:ATP-dependent DNA helicase II subunit 2 n=1 Tax=Macrolepiota fuliginosa MF-IS2 TaxID=1400762 RepID=A0A9P5XET7_9AGAR|nr:SPOC domain-like protein [Macrolepiota fuliginosa MF-IS2]
MTHLEYALRFVKLKVQEMIFNGRKTDQCGVITFGSEETDNIVNDKNGGYDNVEEYIAIGQPNGDTLSKIDDLRPSTVAGDAIDGLIVGIETQAEYLSTKKTWTRKIVLLTNAECPIEVEDWEAIVKKMNALDISLTIVGIDFDDEELPFTEPNKTVHKTANESFYHQLTSGLKSGIVGNCTFALQEIAKPDIKPVRSTLMGTVLRLGDVETSAEEAVEILVKTSKCTALTRPKSWKKYALREDDAGQAMLIDDTKNDPKVVYTPLKMQTEYYVDRSSEEDKDGDVKMEDDETNLLDGDVKPKDQEGKKEDNLEKVEKEELVRGFKYGTTYTPCPDGQFPRLHTTKGIDICGFFPAKRFRRELSMGEVQYIWADPTSPQQQVALSSVVQALYEKGAVAIARWVSKDEMDPKMGVLFPEVFDKVECLLWVQMPFADDVRRYTFASLDNLVSKTGEQITKHPYIPTEIQLDAMDNFVDAMDLMTAGEKDEEGNRTPWFNPADSYNPSIHRTKQAMFHCAVVPDITTNPLPPPHPDLLKYFNPPKKVLKRAKGAAEECKEVFKVKEVPKRVAKAGAKGVKKGHDHALEDDDMLLLDRKREVDSKAGLKAAGSLMDVDSAQPLELVSVSPAKEKGKGKAADQEGSDTEDEDEDEFVAVSLPAENEELLLTRKDPAAGVKTPKPSSHRGAAPLPTPARSVSPQIDPGRAPGRIIGSTYPLKDFEKNLVQGDVVTKAVEDLCEVVVEIVLRPFASRRSGEMIECLKVLRDTCLKEDEIDAWNAFLPNLKEKCLQKPGNPEFWDEVKALGRDISLISNKEARKYGGAASVSERRAEEFVA